MYSYNQFPHIVTAFLIEVYSLEWLTINDCNYDLLLSTLLCFLEHFFLVTANSHSTCYWYHQINSRVISPQFSVASPL